MSDIEIGRTLVYGRHIDVLVVSPVSTIDLWHNEDAALLTGEATLKVTVFKDMSAVDQYTLNLGYGQLHEVVNREYTPEYPGNWDTVIELVERRKTPPPNEMFNLLKNWMRGNYLPEYIGVAIPSAAIGYIVKRK